MLRGLRDDARRWLIGISASGLLLIMGWSATQPTLHYSVAASCSGYGTGNSQSDCQTHTGVAAATGTVAGATGAVQAAGPGLPNTGQPDLMTDSLIGLDLLLIGSTVLVALRRRRRSPLTP